MNRVDKMIMSWIKCPWDIDFSAENLICVEQAHRIYPDAEFHFVMDVKRLPFDWMIHEDWHQWKIRISEEHPEVQRHLFCPVVFTDWFRFGYLSENPYTLWLDCDAYLLTQLDGIPSGKIGSRNIHIIYSNDCPGAIKAVFLKKREGIVTLGELEVEFDKIHVDLGKFVIHKEQNIKHFLENGGSYGRQKT